MSNSTDGNNTLPTLSSNYSLLTVPEEMSTNVVSDDVSACSSTSDDEMVMKSKMKTVKVSLHGYQQQGQDKAGETSNTKAKAAGRQGHPKEDKRQQFAQLRPGGTDNGGVSSGRSMQEHEHPELLAQPGSKKSGFASFSRSKKILKESNMADGEVPLASKTNQIAFLVSTMLSGISYYYVITLLCIVGWSSFCVYYVERTREKSEGDAELQKWVTWLEETDIRMIGNLFVFSLVFRFNQCYNRWWQGRMLWGEIIQNCLDFSRKATLWILDETYCDRLNRYIIAFPYAAKAQLRGLSLSDEQESGAMLVERGYLTQEELDFLEENPCWEPEFILDLMRAVIARIILEQWEKEPDEQYLLLPHSNRIHDRLFPPMDRAVYDLGKSMGEGVSVRSAGLPRSYDTVHYIFFWLYFFLSPFSEGARIGWLAPVYLGACACIIMTLMDMGTAMVDPFGTDLVDLPIERFCETVEAQVLTNQNRKRTGKVMHFATHSTPNVTYYRKGPTNTKAKTKIDLGYA